MKHCRNLFQAIFGDRQGYLCLSVTEDIKAKRGYHERFLRWPDQEEEVVEWVERNKAKDCYFCPHLLSKARRRKEFALPGRAVWSDLDDCQPEELGRYGEPKPTIVVQTSAAQGSRPAHWQCFWLLQSDWEPERYEHLNRRIAVAYADLGADKSGWDRTQLLRIPGTCNNKYNRPFLVKIKGSHSIGYQPEHFGGLPQIEPTDGTMGIAVGANLPQIRIADLRVSQHIKNMIQHDYPVGGRSERIWEVERAMAEAGHSPDEVLSVLLHYPIGEKFGTRQQAEADVRRAFSKEGLEMTPQGQGGAEILNVPLDDYVPRMPAESLIEGLAETRDRIAFAATAGEGKSNKMLCLIAQAARGDPIWGRFAVPRPLKVALIEEELTGERPQDIVRHIAETIGPVPKENVRLLRNQTRHGNDVVEGSFEITDTEAIDKLTNALVAFMADIIIVDGWYKFVKNHENEDDIVEPALQWLDHIANRTNAALFVICHTRKATQLPLGSTGRFDSISGKGLHRWARTKLILRRMSETWKLYSRLYGSSSNPAWGDLDYLVYWNPETWLTSVVGKEETPYELWRIVYPDSSKAESRDTLLRAHAVGITNEDICEITDTKLRAVQYWSSGHTAMPHDKMQRVLARIREKEAQRGWGR